MLYMIVESFKNADPVPVYRRLRDRGRLAPALIIKNRRVGNAHLARLLVITDRHPLSL
jgi:hypothetical protein